VNPTVAIVDIDGVLADATHREHHLAVRPKDWDSFFSDVGGDAPIARGIRQVEELAREHGVVLLTGRPENCREATIEWLDRHSVAFAELVMRPDGDHRPAYVFKSSLVRGRWRPEEVHVILDDDERVVDALHNQGFPAVLVEWLSQA
jgi:hypothetical protein